MQRRFCCRFVLQSELIELKPCGLSPAVEKPRVTSVGRKRLTPGPCRQASSTRVVAPVQYCQLRDSLT